MYKWLSNAGNKPVTRFARPESSTRLGRPVAKASELIANLFWGSGFGGRPEGRAWIIFGWILFGWIKTFFLFFQACFSKFPLQYLRTCSIIVSIFLAGRVRAQVPVLPGECGGRLLEELVDAEEDLLHHSGAQLV